jgi:glutamyl-tRNA reductase
VRQLSKGSYKVFAVGANYASCPVGVREKLSVDISDLQETLADSKARYGFEEVMILSTCNRTEVYAVCSSLSAVSRWFVERINVREEDISSYLYSFEDESVARHLYRVCSGMDSMVLGETQILGQVKKFFQYARDSKTIGSDLNKLFQMSFSVAKKVRTTTAIGENSISLGAATFTLAERIFPDLTSRRVLLIGAGEMIQLCAEHLFGKSITNLYFTNRTPQRVAELAKNTGGEVLPFGVFTEQLHLFDVVISSTASVIPLIGKGTVERAINLRKHRPILFIDLAVPRDVEPEVSQLDDVFLYSIDDMEDIVRSNMTLRRSAIVEADAIIEEGVAQFLAWNTSDESVEVLKAFREFGEELAQQELIKALDALKRSENPEEVLHSFTNALGKKFLDRPSRTINKARGSERGELGLALSKLFNLNDPA